MVDDKPTVPVIVGPTAVGKTALTVALSKYWPVTVISADSRQIYRGLDIGTAKPDPDVLRAVPHIGLDIVEPGQRYSAGRFAGDAARWIGELTTDRFPVVVGGTGFYIRALADGLFREPPMETSVRQRFRTWADGVDGLGGWAVRLDPEYSGGGRQRAARTVEVALLTGRPLSWWQQKARSDGTMRPWYVRLTVPRSFLHTRIEARVIAMLEAGWITEVEGVLSRGVNPHAPGLDGVGYRQIVAHLRGEIPLEELHGAVLASTKQYAKRQDTWFRHQLVGHPVITLDATDPPEVLAGQIVDLWEERTA